MVDGDTILLATNDGTKAGAIVNAAVEVSWMSQSRKHSLTMALWAPDYEPIIVPPGTAVAARFFNNQRVSLDPATSLEDAKALVTPLRPNDVISEPVEGAACQIGLTIANASGRTEELAIPARCTDLHLSIRSAILRPSR
jgi:hypothetical protein